MLAFLTFAAFLKFLLVWRLGFVRVGAIRTAIYWNIRSWAWNYPLTSACPDLWYTGDPNDRQLFLQEKIRLIRIWTFLRPFFASHGYDLFLNKEPSVTFLAACCLSVPAAAKTPVILSPITITATMMTPLSLSL